MKKSFLVAGLIAGLTATNGYAAIDLSGTAVAKELRCPAGCFCLNGGKYNPHGQLQDEMCDQASAHVGPISSGTYYFCNDRSFSFSITGDPNNTNVDYHYDDFSEYYHSYAFGFYGFINGVFTAESGCQYGAEGFLYQFDNIFLCPETYPYSDPGASAITDCYTFQYGDKRVYYKPGETTISNQIQKETAPLNKKIKSGTTSKKINSGLKSKTKTSRAAETPKMVKKIVYEQIVEEDEE